MAASTSFKQQCPSCEAMVPIRDPNLIGRKIDCPKCKYRFVVEEPADSTQDEAPAKPAKKGAGVKGGAKNGATPATEKIRRGEKRDKEEKSDKEEKKVSSTMLIGVGLAVVALALLGVGAWLIFGGDDKKPDKPKPTTTKKDDKPKVTEAPKEVASGDN